MNELTVQVSPMKVNQHRPHQDLDYGPQRSSSGSFSSNSYFNGLCCQCHRDFSVWWESHTSLLGSSMFLPLVLGSDMLLPLGQGPQSVLQNIWDHLYPSMRKFPFSALSSAIVFSGGFSLHESPQKST